MFYSQNLYNPKLLGKKDGVIMKIKEPIDNIVLLLIISQSLLFIFFFPSLEYPDGLFHFEQMLYNDRDGNPYYLILRGVNYLILNVLNINDYNTLINNDLFSYFSWEPLYTHAYYNSWSVMLLQITNVFLVLLSIFIYRLVLSNIKTLHIQEKKMFYRLCLLYFLYPTVGYLVVGITPDFPGYLYQPFFVLLIFLRKHLINLFFCIIIYVFFDQGIILNIYFIIIFILFSFIFKVKMKNKNSIISILTVISVIAIYYLSNFVIVNLFQSEIFDIMKMTQEQSGTLYTKIVNLYLGSFYFLGSGSYVTFPLLYLVFGIIIIRIMYKTFLSKDLNDKKLKSMYLVSFVTIISTILLFPPYSHIRYYLFLIFFILMGFFSSVLRDRYVLSDRKFIIFSGIVFFHNSILTLLISIKTFLL